MKCLPTEMGEKESKIGFYAETYVVGMQEFKIILT